MSVCLHCGALRNLIGRTFDKYKDGLTESRKTRTLAKKVTERLLLIRKVRVVNHTLARYYLEGGGGSARNEKDFK